MYCHLIMSERPNDVLMSPVEMFVYFICKGARRLMGAFIKNHVGECRS